MEPLAHLVKHFLVPGSPVFLVLGLGAGVALAYGTRTAVWGRRWLLLLFVCYFLASLPLVAGILKQGPGANTSVVERVEQARGARTLVILGTGVASIGSRERAVHVPGVNTALNMVEGVRLYQLLGRPRVIVTGGMPPGGAGRVPESAVMREYLLRLGVSDADIVLESESINTFEQARNVSALLRKDEPCILVTVPVHMPRALGLFQTLGVDVIPSASGMIGQVDDDRPMRWRLLPDRYALRSSEDAIYERMAVVLYRMRGQLRAQ